MITIEVNNSHKLQSMLSEYIETNQRLIDLLNKAKISAYGKIVLMLEENINITRRLADELNMEEYNTPEGFKRLTKITIEEARQCVKIEEAWDEYHYHDKSPAR